MRRRKIIASIGAVGISSLAGCLGGGGSGSPNVQVESTEIGSESESYFVNINNRGGSGKIGIISDVVVVSGEPERLGKIVKVDKGENSFVEFNYNFNKNQVREIHTQIISPKQVEQNI